MRKIIRRSSGDSLEPLILTIRGRRVILDANLAHLYKVSTKRFNEAVKRNRLRFPGDFAFQLTKAEFSNLRSQIATSSLSQVTRSGRSKLVAGSHGGRRYLPRAFTEHGALMAANVLRSKRAVQMSIFVVRAFVRLREQLAANAAILKRLAEIDASLLQQDSALRNIYRTLLPLLQPPSDQPRRRIGFERGAR